MGWLVLGFGEERNTKLRWLLYDPRKTVRTDWRRLAEPRSGTFEELRRAAREHSRFIPFLRVWPVFDPLRADEAFDPLRADEAFVALLEEVGLDKT